MTFGISIPWTRVGGSYNSNWWGRKRIQISLRLCDDRTSSRPGENRSTGIVWNPPNWKKVSGSIGGITFRALRGSTG